MFIITAKASQGIQNPLPKGVAVQVRPRAPYLSNRASTKVGALLYLAQSKAYLVFPYVISLKILSNKLTLLPLENLLLSISGTFACRICAQGNLTESNTVLYFEVC